MAGSGALCTVLHIGAVMSRRGVYDVGQDVRVSGPAAADSCRLCSSHLQLPVISVIRREEMRWHATLSLRAFSRRDSVVWRNQLQFELLQISSPVQRARLRYLFHCSADVEKLECPGLSPSGLSADFFWTRREEESLVGRGLRRAVTTGVSLYPSGNSNSLGNSI